jgi:hypothetical protein
MAAQTGKVLLPSKHAVVARVIFVSGGAFGDLKMAAGDSQTRTLTITSGAFRISSKV